MKRRLAVLEFLVTVARIAAGRLRSYLLRLRGAHIGKKSLVGSRSRVDRPWGLHLGERVTLEQEVYLKLVDDNALLILGNHVFVGKGCEFDVMSQLKVGPHTLFAPGCFITDHNHDIAPELRIDQQGCTVKPVIIGKDVWLGTGVVVLQGVSIGDGAVIGARAVVTKDVPSGAIAVGIPARIVGWRDASRQSQL